MEFRWKSSGAFQCCRTGKWQQLHLHVTKIGPLFHCIPGLFQVKSCKILKFLIFVSFMIPYRMFKIYDALFVERFREVAHLGRISSSEQGEILRLCMIIPLAFLRFCHERTVGICVTCKFVVHCKP